MKYRSCGSEGADKTAQTLSPGSGDAAGIMRIRRSALSDLPAMEELYERSRAYMAANGNPSQWGKEYPPVSLLKQDIAKGCSYVCESDGTLIATFMFFIGPEPTYEKIDGAWKNDLPYGVVHRIASGGLRRGAGTFCLNWAWEQCRNLRIDTHRDNLPMQNLLGRLNFEYCGIIHLEDRSERVAFQKVE